MASEPEQGARPERPSLPIEGGLADAAPGFLTIAAPGVPPGGGEVGRTPGT